MTERRSVILDAFERLVARLGLEKTTMRDVADEIGLSVGSLYNEFENRDEMVIEATARLQNWIIDAARPADEASLPAEQALPNVLVRHVEAVVAASHRNRALLEIGLGLTRVKSIRDRAYANRRRVRLALVQALATVLRRGVAEGVFEVADADRTAELMADAISEYWFPYVVLQRQSEDVVRDATDMAHLLTRAVWKGPPPERR